MVPLVLIIKETFILITLIFMSKERKCKYIIKEGLFVNIFFYNLASMFIRDKLFFIYWYKINGSKFKET